MRQIARVLCAAILLAGCGTARLSSGPDVSSLLDHPNAVRWAVAKTVDERAGTKVGTIGFASIHVKHEDLILLTSNHLIECLNQKMDLNVVTIPDATRI